MIADHEGDNSMDGSNQYRRASLVQVATYQTSIVFRFDGIPRLKSDASDGMVISLRWPTEPKETERNKSLRVSAFPVVV